MEVWSGDTGPTPADWDVIFDGSLVTMAKGSSAGTAEASVLHIDAPSGTYHVRAEGRRYTEGDVDAVRFICPESADLTAETL